MPGADFRAARANRVFSMDEKRIRRENTVTVSGKNGVGFLYEPADCADSFCSRNKRNPATAGAAARPALLLFLVSLYQRVG
jgi:hypothetical protein